MNTLESLAALSEKHLNLRVEKLVDTEGLWCVRHNGCFLSLNHQYDEWNMAGCKLLLDAVPKNWAIESSRVGSQFKCGVMGNLKDEFVNFESKWHDLESTATIEAVTLWMEAQKP